MTYYINPIWFYLMNLADGVKLLLCIAGVLATILTILISIFFYFDMGCLDITDMDDDDKIWMKKFKKILIVGIITLFIGILVPSKETCIEMAVASQVTHENVSATKEEIYEIIDYVADNVNKTEKEKKNEADN